MRDLLVLEKKRREKSRKREWIFRSKLTVEGKEGNQFSIGADENGEPLRESVYCLTTTSVCVDCKK